MKSILSLSVCVIVSLLLLSGIGLAQSFEEADLHWPVATQTSQPWTRWWWPGSAVDEATITDLLERYQEAGIGGVEICPIYGVKGEESKFINFLSPRWLKMLNHTLVEANRLGLGVDLTTGTGWPFGGPTVDEADASKSLVIEKLQSDALHRFREILEWPVQAVCAWGPAGERRLLSGVVLPNNRVSWTAPSAGWSVYVLSVKSPVQKVKRAAPGAEGNVLNPYSRSGLKRYLNHFDKRLTGRQKDRIRAQFHDSFEYFQADYSPGIFDRFKRRYGYDVRRYTPELAGDGDSTAVARILTDYRALLHDMHLDYIRVWQDWCRRNGMLARNQAHGAPGNLLDLYAASDIPETEIFRAIDPRQHLMMRFAASAANLSGGNLASAESFTWLDEHFKVGLPAIKSALDHLLISGINHVFFHGTAYSPPGIAWPGWQFYASTHFSPTNSFWRHLPTLNRYITRSQSVLQAGVADQDLLVYFPMHDVWHDGGKLLKQLTVHNQDNWLWPSSLGKVGSFLERRGYTYDLISDTQLMAASADSSSGTVLAADRAYRAIVIPKTHLMPIATLEKLLDLAKRGANVMFQGGLPADVPGFSDLESRRQAQAGLLSEIQFIETEQGMQLLQIGHGSLMLDRTLPAMLAAAKIPRENMADAGLRFARRTYDEGHQYFVNNMGRARFAGWITLSRPAQSVAILDPALPDASGLAALRQNEQGLPQVFVQLERGQSLVLRTFKNREAQGRHWSYIQRASGFTRDMTGPWQVDFLAGGPELPPAYETNALASWTAQPDSLYRNFSGTASYRLDFEKPWFESDSWLLDLGDVQTVARVSLNGHLCADLISAPYRIIIDKYMLKDVNTLEIEVTNLDANRIAAVDRRGIAWRKFYDINFVNIDYEPFDASVWQPMPSGLIGPVTLSPLNIVPHSELVSR